MSPSEELQRYVISALKAHAGVSGIVGARVYEAAPQRVSFPYVDLGYSEYEPQDAECIVGRSESLQIDGWVRDRGKMRVAKALADEIKSCLHEVSGGLAEHALVRLSVERVRVLRDPDMKTAHAIVQIVAEIEETV